LKFEVTIAGALAGWAVTLEPNDAIIAVTLDCIMVRKSPLHLLDFRGVSIYIRGCAPKKSMKENTAMAARTVIATMIMGGRILLGGSGAAW
jgi:hypothetical protein